MIALATLLAGLLLAGCGAPGILGQDTGQRAAESGFLGIRWGAGPAEVKRRLPEVACIAERCAGPVDLDGVPVYLIVNMTPGGGVESFDLEFPPPSFARIRALFVRGYGPPVIDQPGRVHWIGKRVVVVLEAAGRATISGVR